MKLKYLLTICLCFAFAPLAMAESGDDLYQQAYDAEYQGEDTKAVKLYEKACNNGNAKGCNRLGVAYSNAWVVKQNKNQAANLFEKACKNGYEQGCENLHEVAIQIYQSGKASQAAKFLEKNCNLNFAASCRNLGYLYFEGKGVQKNYPKAAKLYEKACNDNDGESCSRIGKLYREGRGVPKNEEKAKEYLRKGCYASTGLFCGLY